MSEWVEKSIVKYDLPIVTLEMRRIMRGKWRFKAILMLVAGLSTFSVIVTYCYWCMVGRSVQSINDVNILALLPFICLCLARAGLLFLVIPIYSARIVAEERESGALQALALTPLSSRSIVAQKLAVVVALAVLAAILSLPAEGLAKLLTHSSFPFPNRPIVGGDWPNFALFPFTALVYASIGILCSCYCSNAMSATAATYVFIVFVLQFVYGILRLVVPVAFETGATGMHSWESAMLVNTLVQAVISLALAALLVWLSIEKFERLRRA